MLELSWCEFKSMNIQVDVGGLMGSPLFMVMKENSLIDRINLDLSHVLVTAPPIIGKFSNVVQHQYKFL